MGKLAITGGETGSAQAVPALANSVLARRIARTPKCFGQPKLGRLILFQISSRACLPGLSPDSTAQIMVSPVAPNGTIAIEIALKAAGIQPGDEVIVPAYTWEGTVGPILLLNAVPVFVDVDSGNVLPRREADRKGLDPEDSRHSSGSPGDAFRRPGRNQPHRACPQTGGD